MILKTYKKLVNGPSKRACKFQLFISAIEKGIGSSDREDVYNKMSNY